MQRCSQIPKLQQTTWKGVWQIINVAMWLHRGNQSPEIFTSELKLQSSSHGALQHWYDDDPECLALPSVSPCKTKNLHTNKHQPAQRVSRNALRVKQMPWAASIYAFIRPQSSWDVFSHCLTQFLLTINQHTIYLCLPASLSKYVNNKGAINWNVCVWPPGTECTKTN